MVEFYWSWLKKAFPLPYQIAGVILFIFTIASPFITRKYPQLEQKMKISLSKITLFLFGVFLLMRLIISPYEIYKEKQQEIIDLKGQVETIKKEIIKFATPEELTASHLKGLSIRIADLVREDIVIRNKVFEDCHIYGPAIITLKKSGIVIDNTFYDVTPDTFFIEVPPKGYIGSGIIIIEDCRFFRCTFHKINFIGPFELKQKVLKGSRFR